MDPEAGSLLDGGLLYHRTGASVLGSPFGHAGEDMPEPSPI